MRTAKFLSILLIVAMLLPLASCKQGGGTIKIGVIAPMTGDAKTFGESTKEGVEMAIAEWNAKGGINGKTLQMVLADDKGDAAEASAAATKLIKQDGVKFIVGSVMSSCSIPISQIANDNKIVQISPTSTNPKVTVADGKRKEYVFRACFIDPPQGSAMANFALNNLKIKSAAVFYDNGNDYVKGLAEFFKAAFEKGGGKVTVYEAYGKDDTDFSALITKVLAANPEMLYLPDYYNKVSLMAKQARDKGFKGVLAGGDGWDSSDLDVKVTEGGYFTNHYSPGDTRPVVQNWVKAYSAKYKTADGKPKTPDALATLAYDAANLLFNAIKTAGTEDTAKVKDALQNTKGFAAISGDITFDKNGDPIKDVTILQIKDGKQKYVTVVKP